MSEIVWANIKDNHFKIWGYDCFVNDANKTAEVITYYGRLGVSMQNLRKNKKLFQGSGYWGNAYDYIRAKVSEKDWKGYVRIPNGEYFELTWDDTPNKLTRIVQLIESKGKTAWEQKDA